MPYLCVAFKTLLLIVAMILSLSLEHCGTHQLKTGSSLMPTDLANSAF